MSHVRAWLPLVALGLAGLCIAVSAPWWVQAAYTLPTVLCAPGVGFARRFGGLGPGADGLQRILDSVWIGLALAWIDVAMVRELGVQADALPWALWTLASGWTVLGLALSRAGSPARPMPTRERVGSWVVVICVAALGLWRADDITRPLDGYWFLEGADQAGPADGHAEKMDLIAATGWADARPVGWDEAGAQVLIPDGGSATLSAPQGARGRVVLAVRGPVGSRISAGGQTNTVAPTMTEVPDEGPVRRYLQRGVAGIAVDIDLPRGGRLPIDVTGEQVYVLPGSEAVWALHAEGVLRYVHYYQLLNQVENQVWAQELLTTRRFTWNQPPGWSPILSTATVLIVDDLPAGNVLFLWVITLVGLSSVRLASVIAPSAPLVAWGVPGAMAAAHGLLMLEPASANFPDSLYAAATLAVTTALVCRRPWAFAMLGVAMQALRWPGAIVSTLLAVFWRIHTRQPVTRGLLWMWAGIAVGGIVALIAIATGDADDLAFILYFETFPEHWHGNYEATALLPRPIEFYGGWLRYSGGGIALFSAMAILGRPGPARQGLRALLAAALLYSAMLATIDHHPTHYFLPLVALTGTGVVVASATIPIRWARQAIPIACMLGLWIFLSMGQV